MATETNDDDGQKRIDSLTISPERIEASTDRTRLDDDDFSERLLFLTDSAGGVTLAAEGTGDGSTGGALVELEAGQARDLGTALVDAADHIDP